MTTPTVTETPIEPQGCLQTAPTLAEAYRLADATRRPVRVPGVSYPIQPDYRPSHTTAR